MSECQGQTDIQEGENSFRFSSVSSQRKELFLFLPLSVLIFCISSSQKHQTHQVHYRLGCQFCCFMLPVRFVAVSGDFVRGAWALSDIGSAFVQRLCGWGLWSGGSAVVLLCGALLKRAVVTQHWLLLSPLHRPRWLSLECGVYIDPENGAHWILKVGRSHSRRVHPQLQSCLLP